MEQKICPKMLQNLGEKLGTKFSATTCDHSMVNKKIIYLKTALIEIYLFS